MPPPTHDPDLPIALDTSHRPLPGWSIRPMAANGGSRERYEVTWDGRADPVYLGYFFDYSGYGEPHPRGLARTPSAARGLPFVPADWTQFGAWPELLYPTAWSESNADFAVLNAWDRAAMTFGFIQLAAHTARTR
ncbi:MAG: hypothetical protein H7X93_14445 [Sphingomonadaceae bacterium]|nr:hypothetical protein [Sphingomonadaceae bacterium]